MIAWFAAVARGADPSGGWVVAEPADAVTAKHDAAIATALAQLPWAFRPFARAPLASAVTNCGHLDIDVRLEGGAEATLAVTCDTDGPHVFPVGEDVPVTGRDGKPYTGRASHGAAGWSLTFDGEDGGQTVVYTPETDGTLRITKSITSKWLSTPITWTVVYQRD